MAAHRPIADLDADIARVTRAARLVIIGSWCAAGLVLVLLAYLALYWLPRYPIGRP